MGLREMKATVNELALFAGEGGAFCPICGEH